MDVRCLTLRRAQFRDINRSLTLMLSDVRPDLLQEFQRSVKDAILFKTKGIKPPPRSPIGGKRRPLSEISPSAKRHKVADDPLPLPLSPLLPLHPGRDGQGRGDNPTPINTKTRTLKP